MHNLKMTALAVAGVLFAGLAIQVATPGGQGFPTPDAAAKALVAAAKSGDVKALLAILGPNAKSIVATRDPVEDRKIRKTFSARASEKMRLVPYPRLRNAKMILAGNDEWPMPI